MANHPVVEVSWYGAVAYCQWLSEMEGLPTSYDLDSWALTAPRSGGYRLPTEAEWERAAGWDPAGSGRHWRYGFTRDSIDCSRANFGYSNPLGLTSDPYTSPVGYYDGVNPGTVNSTSAAGCYDMSGNVWEWCHDWYDSSYYSASPGTDPYGPITGSYRVLRGGGWGIDADYCRSAYRIWGIPRYAYYNSGFRVARPVSAP
jgi:formylglycine-generating enzyme required for sulfatase activity